MRRITQILVFNLFLNAAATVVAASGLAEDLGVRPQTGASEALTAAGEAGQNITASASVVESLLNLIIAGVRVMEAVVRGAFAAPQMFINLGFPAWMTGFIFAPLYLLGAAGLVYLLTGREL